MPRPARRYDLYLPLTFNDGQPIPDELFASAEKRLVERFHGLTAQERDFPLKGIWEGKKQVYFDKVIILTAFDFRSRGSDAFLAKLKKSLLEEFKQLEILLTESPLLVH